MINENNEDRSPDDSDKLDDYRKKLPIVEIKTQYVWMCPDCGTVNTEADEVVSLATIVEEEGEDFAKEMLDLESWQEIDQETLDLTFGTSPLFLACPSCKHEFRASLDGLPAFGDEEVEDSDEDDGFNEFYG